jgi:hypothetical protein
MATLLEYYKYHRNIPRMFMAKVCKVINRFHERKRKIEYGIIKRRLGIKDDEVMVVVVVVDDHYFSKRSSSSRVQGNEMRIGRRTRFQ